jgi:propanol-preferring alcohol dehydrogenase
MRAALLYEFKRPLVVQELSLPTLDADEILIEVEACGVCHSDLHLADGDWPELARIIRKPLILGHEISGRVAERGSAVRDFEVGDRVGVPWLHWSCGVCEFCCEGNENLCARQKITGVNVPGGYAEFVKAPASHALKIPEELTAISAAPLFCAGVTVYRALKQARICRGQRLAIFGIGGLGHLAVQMGKAMGAHVIAIDVSEEKLRLAQSFGASHTIHAASAELTKVLRDMGGVHMALVTSASKAAYDAAFACVRPSGTMLVVGLPSENISFSPILMAAREIRLQASAVGTRQDLRETLQLAAEKKIRCEVSSRPLTQVNEVMEDLRAGRITGRMVITPC